MPHFFISHYTDGVLHFAIYYIYIYIPGTQAPCSSSHAAPTYFFPVNSCPGLACAYYPRRPRVTPLSRSTSAHSVAIRSCPHHGDPNAPPSAPVCFSLDALLGSCTDLVLLCLCVLLRFDTYILYLTVLPTVSLSSACTTPVQPSPAECLSVLQFLGANFSAIPRVVLHPALTVFEEHLRALGRRRRWPLHVVEFFRPRTAVSPTTCLFPVSHPLSAPSLYPLAPWSPSSLRPQLFVRYLSVQSQGACIGFVGTFVCLLATFRRLMPALLQFHWRTLPTLSPLAPLSIACPRNPGPRRFFDPSSAGHTVVYVELASFALLLDC